MQASAPSARLFRRGFPSRGRILALALICAWAGYLWVYMPRVSRGDFLLAILRVSDAVRDHDWLYALTWPLHVLGGHIVFYERALQLFNYYLLGYSPLFVKACAVAAWMLLGWGVLRLVERNEERPAARIVLLVGLFLVSCNPIPWDVLAWPDANIPYLSSLLALLFAGPAILRILDAPMDGAAWRRLALLAILVIIGSGVGWSIVPAIVYILLLNAVLRRDYRHAALIVGVVAALALLAGAVLFLFTESLRMGLAAESLAEMDPAQLASYFLALQGTLFGVGERALAVRVGGALFIAAIAVYLAYKRKHRAVTEPELLFVFGVVSLLLVSLGRWKLNMERPTANLPTYYHIFALPYFYGLLLMLARVLPQRAAAWGMGAVFAAIVAVAAPRLDYYHRNFRGQGESYSQMVVAVSGWRMTEALRLIGETFFNQQIFLEFLPALKADGKYRALSAEFQPYRSSRISPPQPSANGHGCNMQYRNLDVLNVSRDRRAPYTQGDPEKPFYRFVGVARNPAHCDDGHVAVSLVSADGTVNCKSWTTENVYWHYDAKEHADILRSPYAFDFSCPVETPGPLYLVSSEQKGGRIIDAVMLPGVGRPEAQP